ncbi:MAG: flagellar biosynthetic protein FliQ [Pelagerythrobacter marensis]|uniref:flagellar biosynthetic protein FliQ n=1 Tax=Qipengyuania sp. YIM B01966 TaxID=2778646 RepID=UPI000DB5A784|nr:flagellar biosynthetic protein FliQ [Qipengyuania sp. YIM B01966]PZO71981.1 MAG: flagellar biosynthetic protein FliQ [Pelagerythrobacter marensis]PZU16855.1 MAG: flagellar biosynthetic protein FliQ [Citromicrobium sp.]
MSGSEVAALAQSAFWVVLAIAGPMLLAALVVGVGIGLLQALTQVQEMTLTFVPKLLVIGGVFLLSLPMIGHAMGGFMAETSQLITRGR